jgi:hypothetical protein
MVMAFPPLLHGYLSLSSELLDSSKVARTWFEVGGCISILAFDWLLSSDDYCDDDDDDDYYYYIGFGCIFVLCFL